LDLVVEATRTGFEQFLVVKQRPASAAAVAVSLPLVLRGLSTRASADGAVQLVDGSGRVDGALGAPVMWDATVDAGSGEHLHRAAVPATVTGSGSGVELGLAPAAGFLLDPGTVYPVTIDPSYTNQLYPSFDTFAATDYSTDQSGSTELRLGSYDGVTKSRSLFNLTMTPWAGKQILNADLALWEFHSWSCSARQWEVWRTDPASTATRWTAMGTWWSHWGDSTETKGYSTSCAAGWVQADITGLIQAWADQNAGAVGIGVKATNELDTFSWKKFNSGNAASAPPRINITYDSYPTVGTRSTVPATTCVTGASRPWVNTKTPTLKAAVSDPDGGTVSGNFEVYPTGGSAGPVTWSATVAASGGVASAAVAAGKLAENSPYSWRVRAYDGSIYSKAWSSWCEFSVDTTKPATPTVSSTAYPAGQWNLTGGAGSFTLSGSDTPSGVASWRYWLDSGAPTTVAGGNSASVSITPANGWHILHVQALDKAGNASDEATYAFGAVAGVTSPAEGQRTQRFVTLGAVGPPAATAVRFQYSLPGSGTWADVPTSAVTLAGAPVAAWPVATVAGTSSAAAPANLVWDVRATLSTVDNPVQVRAVLTGGASSWTTDTPTATLDQKAFGDSYATEEAGPGSVSLLTGNYSVTDSDVSIDAWGSDLTVSRTFNSLSAATGTGIFGPGWSTTLAVEETDSEWTGLKDTGSGVLLSDVDGGLTVFAKSGSAYLAQADAAADGLKLSKTASPDEFTLTDLDGQSSTFGFVSGPATATLTAPRVYRLVRVTQPGSNQVTTYSYNTDGTPAQILAPKPATTTVCDATTWSPGCRALQLTYASGKLTKVTIKTTDGAGAVKVVDAACYTYDAAGRLAQEWDPTVGGSCAAPTLPVSYGYDGAGRLATVTPAGLAAWSIGYDTAGRFDHISRSHDAAHGSGTETATLRYDAPIGAATGTDETHPDLSAGRVAAWAQTDLAVTGTAVFGPGDTVSATDLRDGEVHALDVNGRVVNTAAFSGTGQAGWKVDTSEFDPTGNQIRTLSAADRDLALTGDPTTLGLPAGTSSAGFAQAVDSRSIYTADGTDLLDTYGPLHTVAIDGAWVAAREHTHATYGSLDAPGTDPTVDGPKHAPIASTTAASQSPDPTPTAETDVRTTRTAYGLPGDSTGWTLKQPMRETTVVPGGTDVVKETLYNAATGLVTQSRMPSAAGSATAVGTTLTTYYTAGTRNDAGCVNSAWINLVCKIQPASQPTTAGLPKLPVTWTTYDWLGRPTTVTETVIDAAGATQTRTSTTEYENGGLSPRVHRTLTTATVGTPVPAVLAGYDPATGLATTTATDTTPAPGAGMAGATTTAYDDFGRTTSFTDADGATTLTTYTTAGRVGTVTSKASSGTVLGTTSYGYNAGTEHRGLATSLTDTALSGPVTGSYDPDGALITQAFPTGMTQTITRDPTADPTKVIWAKAGVEWVNDNQSSSIHGQQRWHSGPAASQAYGYDSAGRLTTVWDDPVGSDCVQRSYSFDVDSNRTQAQAWPAAPDGGCPPATTPTTTTHAYDPADRLLPTGGDTGLAYDAFGRTTTLPAALAGGTTTTMGYYGTDMVASQTQGTASRSWTLDPAGRLRAAAASGVPTKTNHYDDPSSDSPTWIDESTGAATLTATRYLTGLDGNLVASIAYTGTTTTATWQLVNLHGDVATTSTDNSTLTTPDGPTLDADEYGNPRSTTTARYGWLGGKQRSTDTLAGLILMGARLYNPTLGRFLQTDPEPGGSCNDYDYTCADPINAYDLDGRWPHWARRAASWAWHHKVDIGLTALSFAPGLGEAAWAYRAYRGYRVYRTYRAARAIRYAARACRNSFTPDTQVLMADGSTRDIDEIQVGDLVLAADPDTGDVTAEPVTDLIIGSGEKELVTITADSDGDGHPDDLTATTNHPFYTGNRWKNAGDLTLTDRLTTDTWATYPLDRVTRHAPRHATVYNLTVADLHTYYVLLDDTPTLVHNCGTFFRSLSPFHGKEFAIGRNFRFKPFGHWRGRRTVERLPHYHSRRMHHASGRSGYGWHRPWETAFRRWF
jgi:RHS repeat-associated protein